MELGRQHLLGFTRMPRLDDADLQNLTFASLPREIRLAIAEAQIRSEEAYRAADQARRQSPGPDAQERYLLARERMIRLEQASEAARRGSRPALLDLLAQVTKVFAD